MAGYGWSYLVVTHALAESDFRTSDGGWFPSEADMFRELGVTGWELVSIRETEGTVIYYFKRGRS